MIQRLRRVARLLKKGFSSQVRLIYDESELSSNDILSVSFTGGMGAQILSAAIYFDFKSRGVPVKADFSYFDNKPRIALAGCDKEISQWGWQLQEYGLDQLSFASDVIGSPLGSDYFLPDGALKLHLAMQALQGPAIKACFPLPPLESLISSFPPESKQSFERPYICIHIRRGDYVNVASYLVPDEDFISLCGRFKSLVSTAVVVSDSDLSESFRDRLRIIFNDVVFLDGAAVSAFFTHCIMRYSTILVCSNSQFSVTAAALSEGVSLIPKVWLGDGHDLLKKQIDQLSQFSVLS